MESLWQRPGKYNYWVDFSGTCFALKYQIKQHDRLFWHYVGFTYGMRIVYERWPVTVTIDGFFLSTCSVYEHPKAQEGVQIQCQE